MYLLGKHKKGDLIVTHELSASIDVIITRVVAYAHEQLPKAQVALVEKFIQIYFSNVIVEDIESRSISDLYGMVFSHWDLMYRRRPGALKIHVFNPNYEEHGWQSTHTIIQAVVDDMPFLIDSIRMELYRLGLTTHLMIYMGGVEVSRNAKCQMDNILPYHMGRVGKKVIEAPIYMEIDRQTDPKVLSEIQRNIKRVVRDVCAVVEDWPLMVACAREALNELNAKWMVQSVEDVAEVKAFLSWLMQDHFTFLGFRDYEMVGEGKERALRLIPHSGLGVLRDHTHSKMLRQYSDLPKKAREIALKNDLKMTPIKSSQNVGNWLLILMDPQTR